MYIQKETFAQNDKNCSTCDNSAYKNIDGKSPWPGKNIKQRSLADSMLIEHDAIKELDEIYSLIDWTRIEQLLTDIYSSPRGNKAWPPIMMFRALLLQSWHKLSDEGLEKQWARDLLFRRFTGLDISESVPDHSTIWRFRQKLVKDNLMDSLLSVLNNQLSEQGLYIKTGEVSIIDASVIEAKNSRPNKGKNGNPTQVSDVNYFGRSYCLIR